MGESWFIAVLSVMILLGGVSAQTGFCPNNLIYDGSFESTGALCTSPAGVCSIGYNGNLPFAVNPSPPPAGWVLVSGNLDLVSTANWLSDTGSWVIDLDGNTEGTISQQFACSRGINYQVSWAISSNTGGCAPPPRSYIVTVSNSQGIIYTNTYTENNYVGTYTHVQFGFNTGTSGTCTIQFASNTPGACGAILDSVCVTVAPVQCLSLWSCSGCTSAITVISPKSGGCSPITNVYPAQPDTGGNPAVLVESTGLNQFYSVSCTGGTCLEEFVANLGSSGLCITGGSDILRTDETIQIYTCDITAPSVCGFISSTPTTETFHFNTVGSDSSGTASSPDCVCVDTGTSTCGGFSTTSLSPSAFRRSGLKALQARFMELNATDPDRVPSKVWNYFF